MLYCTDFANCLFYIIVKDHICSSSIRMVLVTILRVLSDDWWSGSGLCCQLSWYIHICPGDCLSLCDGRSQVWGQLKSEIGYTSVELTKVLSVVSGWLSLQVHWTFSRKLVQSRPAVTLRIMKCWPNSKPFTRCEPTRQEACDFQGWTDTIYPFWQIFSPYS